MSTGGSAAEKPHVARLLADFNILSIAWLRTIEGHIKFAHDTSLAARRANVTDARTENSKLL